MELFRLFGSILIEDKEAIEALKKADEAGKKTTSGMESKFSKMAGVVGKSMLAVGTAVVAAVGATAVAAVNFGDDLQKSLNGLQATVGLTDDEMAGMRDTMIDIYNNNLGENFEDIGIAMSEVARQTKLTDEELQKATESALILRDTFGYEVAESTRAAKAMMDQFGYSSEQAYNLIAQGAQLGLDKNGDFMDVINEYAVHFDQLGLDGEQMFNVLKAGADNGAFSIDKVGDAFKEFGIRVKDESDATAGAFEAMGLGSEEMTRAFANGGDEAEDAFYRVYESLMAMEDPVAQNQAGIALFGTMWEDMGGKATLAAMNFGDEFNKTTDTINQINETKYDSFGEAMSGIGRQLQTSFLLPISDSLLPILGKLTDKISENMPAIQTFVENAMSKIGAAIEFVGGYIQFFIDGFDNIKQMLADSGIWDTFKGYLDGLVQFWTGLFNGEGNLGETFARIFGMIRDVAMPILNDAIEFAKGIIGQLTAFWDENGQQIVQAVQNAFQFIANIIQFIMPVVSMIITTVWENIKGVFQGALDIIMGAVKIFTGLFTGDWSKLWEGVKQLFSGGLEFIWNLWNLIAMGKLLGGIKTFITSGFASLKGFVNNIINAFRSGGTSISGIFTTIRTTITNIASSIRTGVSGAFNGLWNSVKTIWNGIKNAITNPIQTAKNTISGIINAIKGLFNFKITWPRIPMPSFGISPSGWKIGDLLKGSIPKLAVNWNAEGGVFDEPTIFNTSRGLQGVGEAGPEAILPLNKETYSGMAEGIVEAIGKMTNSNTEQNNRPIILQVDGKTFAELIGDYTDNVDGARIRTVARGLA